MERAALDRRARALEDGNPAEAAALLTDHGIPAPLLLWRPEPADLPTPELRFLDAYWRGLAAPPEQPLARRVEPFDLKPALGHIMLLDLVEAGWDFRYRLYGSKIAAHAGFDMTGLLVSQLKSSPVAARFYLAVYRAVLHAGAPILTRHRAPADQVSATWNRLILPLWGEDGAIVRLLVGNVPTPAAEWPGPSGA